KQRLDRPVLHEQLEDEQQPEHDAEREAEAVEARLLPLPDEQRGPLANPEAHEIRDDDQVRDQKPDAEEEENPLQQVLQPHGHLPLPGFGIRDSRLRSPSFGGQAGLDGSRLGRGPEIRIETDAAASLIHPLRADQYAVATRDES